MLHPNIQNRRTGASVIQHRSKKTGAQFERLEKDLHQRLKLRRITERSQPGEEARLHS